MEKSQHHSVKDVPALDLAAITTNTVSPGNIIDTNGFESCEFIVQAKTITDGAYALKLEESDAANFSNPQDVPSELVLGALTGFTDSDSDTTIRIGSISKKPYQRLSIVSTGTSTGVDSIGAVCILGHPKHGLIPQ